MHNEGPVMLCILPRSAMLSDRFERADLRSHLNFLELLDLFFIKLTIHDHLVVVKGKMIKWS